ncbi:MAG: hypothetical protein LUC24_02655, partial [Bacteroidales bacterium]|nr:hypothetical protein [Bacteroidales bacterium]
MRLFTTILSAALLLTLPFAGAEAAAATGVTKHQNKKTSKKKAAADTVYITDTVYVPYDASGAVDSSTGFSGELGGSDINFDELYGAPADAPTQ